MNAHLKFGAEMKNNVLLLAAVAAFFTAGCASEAAKQAFENYADRRIGREVQSLDATVECSTIDGEYGCLRTNPWGCKAWFTVERSTGRITAWRYVGAPEVCWRHHGLL